ncbi:hypothetical protein VTN77DRAFT_4634 [Rasamsonia byssochlamydoides]|uniref:uncharacterized protein n=1 Tax=Rasamsonia byssochlamydoides TaxID=89139 RepID=UPI0037427C6A
MALANGLDDLDYLSPDFDLNSLTVPRLRAILVSHDVPYPASAKKAQLIRILEEEILPKAKKLLMERERVRRTSAGITDMSRPTTATNDDDGNDRESMPPPPTPSTTSTARRGRSRPSTRASTADTEESIVPPTPGSTRRRPARAKHMETGEDTISTPSVADATPRTRSTARKLRMSEAIPSTEATEPSPSIKTESRDGSVFTDENPFQSGSSPTSWDQTPRARTLSGDRKPRSSPTVAKEERLKRTSEVPVKVKQEDDFTKSTFDFPVPRGRTPSPKVKEEWEDEEVPAGEEFTPEEQLALETEAAQTRDAVAARRRSQKQSRASRAGPWIVILSLLIGFGVWWRKEKIEIGFCGVGKPHWSLVDTNVPDWVDILEPQCEPCPPHAFCYPEFEVQCERDFILKPHPLSLGGLVPLVPTCEPDSEKARRVKAVADRAVEELRDRRARYECGDGQEVKSAAISEPELKQAMAKKKRKGMSDAEFDDLWKGAIGEIVAREEVTSQQGPSSVLILSSTSLARLPIGCALRRHLRLSLLAYRLPLSILVVSMLALAYVRRQIQARRSDIARVPELVSTTLDRLSTQAALYARGEAPEPWIPIGQLRDDVLRSELRGSRREELWKRVRSVVEGNANVRAAVREGRGGEVSRVWEWIGGIGGHLDAVRRESGHVRFSQSQSPGEAASEDRGESGDKGAQSPRESRKWNEGRPIY